MANLGKGRKGYIFIGVSDKEADTELIENLDSISAPRFFSFGVVGLGGAEKSWKADCG